MKICSKCRLPKEDFYVQKRRKDGLHSWCKQCLREARKSRTRTEERKEYEVRRNLRIKYNTTPEAVEELKLRQNGCCAICEKPLEQFHIDHDHKTGKVRGLLCGKCNLALGLMDDNPETFRAGARYLEKQS